MVDVSFLKLNLDITPLLKILEKKPNPQQEARALAVLDLVALYEGSTRFNLDHNKVNAGDMIAFMNERYVFYRDFLAKLAVVNPQGVSKQ